MDRSLLVLTLVAIGVVGCDSTSVTLDGGPSTDAMVPRGQLSIVSEVPIGLTFGTETELVVRYTEDDLPVAARNIRFALEGTAHDSTLSALSVDTDRDGLARTALVAGSVAAVFRVRANREGASPVYADVSVGDEGFGGLIVRAEYDGARGPVMKRVLSVYANTECDPVDGYPRFPARMATLGAEEPLDASWRTLTAGLRYAVVGVVEGPTGTALASGCVDDILVEAGQDTEKVLTFVDAPLLPEGPYDAELVVHSSDAATLVADRILETSALSLVDVGTYLDALEAILRAAGEIAAADALSEARTDTDLEARLADALDAADVGIPAALSALIDRLTERLETIRLAGTFDLSTASSGVNAVFVPASMVIGSGEPDGLAPLTLTLVLPTRINMSFGWRDEWDRLEATDVPVGLPLGRIAVAALLAEAEPGGPLGVALLPASGCETFAEFITDEAGLLPVCDETCAHDACVAGLSGLAVVLSTELMRLDTDRAEVHLTGLINVSDEDGNAVVDRLTAEDLSVRWSGPADLDGSAGTAEWSATRILR